jgi:RNA polymerase sigma-70 factor (ECF subfamily)
MPAAPTSPADAALAARAARGDQQAFAAIVRRHDARVRRVCSGILRSAPDADDAAQEAWLRAWRAMPRFAGGALDAWLLTIARREAYRIAVRRAAAPIPTERVPERPDLGADPLTRARGAELAAGLALAVRDLPASYRELAARDLAGQPPQEVAEALGLRPGTARVRAFRARRMLAARMGALDVAA